MKISILDRYVGKIVVINIGLALLVLVALDSFFALVSELDEIGRGDYSFTEMLLYIGLTMPHRIVEYFRIAVLLGAITGLGMMASNSELTVMRAAGLSIAQITLSVMKTGLLLVVVFFSTAEYVVPPAEDYAETRRSLKIAEQTALKSKYGFWSRDGFSFINIRNADISGQIGDVYIYEFDKDYKLRRSSHAGKADYINGEWILSDIAQSDIHETGVNTSRHKQAKWSSLLNPDLLNIISINPVYMSISELSTYVDFLRDNGQDAERFSLALWGKIVSPLAIAVMLLLAIPFVFGPLRSVGIGQRIMVGFLVGLSFYIINQAFGHLGVVYAVPSIISVLLPIVLFFTIAMVLLRRI
jgi:lipopolysaccharide export system permease protein